MEILECITEQISGNRLPLVAVTLAAVSCPGTPVILTLHWHGFRKDVANDNETHRMLAPVPSSSLQINAHWSDLLDVDAAALEAGWELGASNVVRAERPPCLRRSGSAAEAMDCLNAFGDGTAAYAGAELFLAEAPDRDELIGIAGHAGYLYWQFRPVHGGLWSGAHDDATLDADGKRAPRCPLEQVRPHCDGRHSTVYRFGEGGVQPPGLI